MKWQSYVAVCFPQRFTYKYSHRLPCYYCDYLFAVLEEHTHSVGPSLMTVLEILSLQFNHVMMAGTAQGGQTRWQQYKLTSRVKPHLLQNKLFLWVSGSGFVCLLQSVMTERLVNTHSRARLVTVNNWAPFWQCSCLLMLRIHFPLTVFRIIPLPESR